MTPTAGNIGELMRLAWCRQLYAGFGRSGFGVVEHGRPNAADGPELLDVRFELGEMACNGPVAIHEYASDWHRHGHSGDPAYDDCALNLVLHDDAVVCRTDGSVVPSVTMLLPEQLTGKYESLSEGSGCCDCAEFLAGMPAVKRYGLLTELTCERLERKYDEFALRYRESGNNWNEVFFVSLFRTMGAGSNRESYEKLARTVSYTQICRVRESALSVEALLLGAAGLLEEGADDYADSLANEFRHLRRRFNIAPMRCNAWNLGCGRPDQKPLVRIAELAALLTAEEFLFSRLVGCKTQDEIRQIFSATASDYWTTHYRFGQPSKRVGEMMLDNLSINLVAPMIFTYGKINRDEELKETAIAILEQVRAENHIRIIKNWKSGGLNPDNAFFSQGLLQLTREYCEKNRCAACNIGRIVLCCQ